MGIERVKHPADAWNRAIAGEVKGERIVVARAAGDYLGSALELRRIGKLEGQAAAARAASTPPGALRYDPALVQKADATGKIVGLFQVLGGKKDADAGRNSS